MLRVAVRGRPGRAGLTGVSRVGLARGLVSTVQRCAAPRTVPVPCGLRRVAQLLSEVCSNDAGAYVAARTDDGRPVSLSEQVGDEGNTPASLTFLPFDAEDKLAQRSFWLSAAFMLSAALESQYGQHMLTASPTVITSTSDSADGMAGFTYDVVRSAPLDPVDYGASATEAKANVAAALRALFAAQHAAPQLSQEELASLDTELKRLSTAGHEFLQSSVPWDEAWSMFASNPLKLHTLLQFAEAAGIERPDVPIVRLSKTAFVDLGPWQCDDAVLLRRTKPIKACKLLGWSTISLPSSLASAAQVDTQQQPLLRIRGIAFPSAAALQAYAAKRLESDKADHRLLGLAQSLFFSHDSSPGSPFVMAHGMRLIRRVERVIRDLYDTFGYEEVQTPQLYRSSLWKQSGHWDKYRDDMFSASGFTEEAAAQSTCCGAHDAQSHLFGLKPMNCPGHCILYAHQPRSYRELPMRLAEFSPLHRNEASGALSGLTRVRRFHQDDAHVFCTPDQVSREIESMLRMLALAYAVFGFGDRFELVLSTRPASFLGEVARWDQAEASLTHALNASGRPWTLNEGDGAFYGPKIDIRLVDATGRKHQTATIQLDFQLPERFALEYATQDPTETTPGLRPGHARPVMIHRAILGSFERFLAILLEQCRGWWPFWLSPRQAVVIPTFGTNDPVVHEKVRTYAQEVCRKLRTGAEHDHAQQPHGPFLSPAMAHHTLQIPSRSRFFVELPPAYLDPSGDTLAKKIRQAQQQRYNFFLVIGQQELERGTVRLRIRDEHAAPAWHTPVRDEAGDGTPIKVNEMVLAAARATFPGMGEVTGVDWGEWQLDDVRRLFCVLDTLHV